MTTLSYDYPPGSVQKDHFHSEDQLLYAVAGAMTVRTPDGIWVVPPRRAVWIPAQVIHETRMSGCVKMRTLWFSRNRIKRLPRRCCVLNISPILHELILHTCDIGGLNQNDTSHSRLLSMVRDHLQESQELPLQLPMPKDSRALKLINRLMKDPSLAETLDLMSVNAGASKRTIERIFQVETGLPFQKWRQQFRLLIALQHLAEGEKISQIAFETGYSSPSAFIAMFKATLGKTPGQYFSST